MALVFTNGTATIGTTEYSLAQNANYSSGSPKTTVGYVFAFVDLSALTAAEQYQMRIYERVNAGTQRVFFEATVTGAQAQAYTFPMLLLGDGWDVTAKKLAGTDRSILFSVRQDTNDGSISGLGAGAITSTTFATGAITSTTFAANSITAAAIATDAIDADALAADAATEIRTGLATSAALTTAQTDLTTLTGRLTAGRATGLDNLDAAVTTRAAASTAVSSVNLTPTRAALLDNLDATVSSRAPSSTAVSSVDLTPTRAAKLDQLDAAVTTRAAAATALSTVQWTNTRAGNLDRLDVASSTLATASGQTAISVAVAAVQADTDDIQARLPATLDAGNMRASVQALTAGAVAAIAVGVMVSVVETGITVTGALRLLLSEAVGQVSGFLAGAPVFRDVNNTKNRITGTTTTDGRTSVTVDPT